MTGAVGAELLKLRTVRSSGLVLLAAVAIVVAGVSGLVVSGADLASAAVQQQAVAHVGLVALCSLVLGVLMMAGEYRHGTVVGTFLGEPRRGRVVLAKLLVALLAGAVLGLASALAALLAAGAWWAAEGESFGFADPDVLRTLAGGVAWNVLFAALGVAVGALVRNVGGAIAVALAWVALVEGIVGQLVGDQAARWLPLQAGRALGQVSATGGSLLPQWGAATVLAGYVVVLTAAATAVTVSRDVT